MIKFAEKFFSQRMTKYPQEWDETFDKIFLTNKTIWFTFSIFMNVYNDEKKTKESKTNSREIWIWALL